MFDDTVNPVQPHQEVGVLPEEAVVPCRRGVARQGRFFKVEHSLEVLDGGDGDLVSGIHGDALAETGEDVLQLLVGLCGLWEGRA